MSRHHILTPSWTSGAVATSNGSVTPDVDADNLLKVQHTRKFRSSAASNVQITLDALTAKPFDTVFLGYHNGIAADQVTITANASTGTLFSAPSFSFGPTSMTFAGDLSAYLEHDIWINVGGTQTYRYIGIEIDAPTNPDAYVEAGVVVVGEDFEPDIGMDLGWKFGMEDPSDMRRTLSGEAIVRAKRSYKTLSGTFPRQGNTDAMRFFQTNYIYGRKIPVVAKWDPYTSGLEQAFIIYGHIQWPNGGPLTHVHGDPLWDVEFAIEEV